MLVFFEQNGEKFNNVTNLIKRHQENKNYWNKLQMSVSLTFLADQLLRNLVKRSI